MPRRLLTAVTASLLAATLSLGVASCSSGSDSSTVSVSSGPTATAAPASGSTLPAADFAAALKRPGTTILDVRTPQEFAQGHLAGAINIDVENVSFPQEVDKLDRSGTYAVYCRSGSRSAVAMKYMLSQGFTTVYDLQGGIGEWEKSGGKVVTG